jgi:ribosomal protein S18 acetylase RimI-like enzyme
MADWTGLTVRELPVVEWPRVQHLAHAAFQQTPVLDPNELKIMVAETSSGEIVGYVVAYTCVHVEPIWVHEDYRRKPGVIRKLWRGAAQMLQRSGITFAFATIGIHDAPSNQALAQHLGFTRLPADLYALEIPPGSVTLPDTGTEG